MAGLTGARGIRVLARSAGIQRRRSSSATPISAPIGWGRDCPVGRRIPGSSNLICFALTARHSFRNGGASASTLVLQGCDTRWSAQGLDPCRKFVSKNVDCATDPLVRRWRRNVFRHLVFAHKRLANQRCGQPRDARRLRNSNKVGAGSDLVFAHFMPKDNASRQHIALANANRVRLQKAAGVVIYLIRLVTQ